MRTIRLTLAGLCLALAAGCSNKPVDTTRAVDAYPVRADWLVANSISVSPTKFYSPGYPPLLTLADGTGNGDIQALWGETKNFNILDTRKVVGDERRQLQATLDGLFGSPASPKVESVSAEVKKAVDYLRLDGDTLKAGSKVFSSYCITCHGETGNGNGPTGKTLVPAARDYRPGIFKWISTDSFALAPDGTTVGHKPRRADLIRTLVHGMDGAPMPSFAGLTSDELNAVVSYVMHLSIRGEVEYEVMRVIADPRGEGMEDIAGEANKLLKAIAPRWVAADRHPIMTDAMLADFAIARGQVENLRQVVQVASADVKPGYEAQLKDAERLLDQLTVQRERGDVGALADEYRDLFLTGGPEAAQGKLLDSAARGFDLWADGKVAACATCHLGYGANGAYKYDRWGTIVRARNLTTSNYRGGRKPEQIYSRLYNGIYGSGMQSFHAGDASLRQTPDDRIKREHKMWDVVNFVLSLSQPEVLKKLEMEKGKKVEY